MTRSERHQIYHSRFTFHVSRFTFHVSRFTFHARYPQRGGDTVEPSVFVEVTRGPIVESVHYGAAAVADPRGELVAQAGDAGFVSYYRSASKPIQAIPLVESGAAAHFGL